MRFGVSNTLDIEFNFDAGFFTVVTRNGVIQMPANPEFIFEKLCERGGRNLDSEQWGEFIGEMLDKRESCPSWR